MMAGKNRLIHTPEGVRDSYNAECRKKLAINTKHYMVLYFYLHLRSIMRWQGKGYL